MISINRKTFALSAILAFLAWIGNWLNMPLFFGVDFIFGSIAAMLAAALLGPVPATVIAATGGLYTLALWNQPYALIIFTAEALTVALLYRRGLHNLILADLVFWVFLGLPLILSFYRGMIGMEWQSTLLIAFKQPLNGVFNALVAGIILLTIQTVFRSTTQPDRDRPSLSELLFHVLLCSILLAGAIPIIVESNAQKNLHEAFMLDRLTQNAKRAAADIASAPDADIEIWRKDLARAQTSPRMGLALLDSDGRVFIGQGELAVIGRQYGEILHLNERLAVWLPPRANLSAMDRWKQGRYLTAMPVTGVANVAQVYIEQDAESLLLDFEQGRLPLFLSLTLLFLSGITVSRFLSNWLTRSLRDLETASFRLTDSIGNGIEPNLPASAILEYNNLANSLRDMAQSLTDSFSEQCKIHADLERQVQARTADLKQNRDQYQSLVSNIPGIVYRCKLDENWTMLYMSAIVDNISGYPAGDFIDNTVRSYASVIHPDDAESVERSVYGAIASGTGWELEYRILHKDGSIRWAYEKGTAISNIAGNIDFLDGFIIDITDRKRAEAALKEQSRHTKAILDTIVDGIITIDRTGKIDSFNPAAERIFGYQATEIAGRNIKILMPNPHRDAHDSYLHNYQSTGNAQIIGIGREVEGLRKNGKLFPMEVAISEIILQGQPMYVGMVRDITERKRIDRMKNEFVATVSHELRTPLTSISGALGLLNGGVLGELPKPVLEIISIAYDNSRRLADLIDDLLDMEKITNGKLLFDMQKQILMPLIEQTLDANRTYGIGRQVSLILIGERPKVDIYVDEQRLQQVLSNLLSNAIKFSPDGGDVYINVKQINKSIRITVADRGPGIPDSFRDRVFQKFAQADASDTRKKGGTGLGLAISKELIERMGGRIGFESIEGEGASFYFELPIRKV